MNDIFVDEGDADSLFGSRSPSPSIGFVSESPALPGSPVASSASLAKNVGTIALPGSHSDAELVVSLPASPPRDRFCGSQLPRQSATERPQPVSSTSSSSKRNTQAKRRKSKKSTSGTSTPGPSITLPGASVPVPPNFLRNQQALLGLAGVVGNVRPVKLAKGVSRGTSPSNPIVLEEGSDCAAPSFQSAGAAKSTPTRNGQEIADALTAQHDIFPVLRSLLPFLNAAADARRSNGARWRRGSVLASKQDNSVSPNPPPLKKRRLKSVPAGAKDWDVPYPFANNEGPSQYLKAWEKKKAHALMTQLNTLVRQAVEKATATETVAQPSNSAATPPVDTDSSLISIGTSDATGSSPSPDPSSCSSPSLFDYDPFASFQDADLDNLLGAVNNMLDIPDFDVSSTDFLASPPASGSIDAADGSPTPSQLSSHMSAPAAKTHSGEPSQHAFVSGWDDIPIDPKILDLQWASNTSDNHPLSMSPMDGLDLSFLSSVISDCEAASMTARTQSQDDKVSETRSSRMMPYDCTYEQRRESSVSVSRTETPASCDGMGSGLLSKLLTDGLQLSSSSQRNTAAGAKQPGRDELLKRANARREQLANELARTKVELWETTIEQGVLTGIVKDDQFASISY